MIVTLNQVQDLTRQKRNQDRMLKRVQKHDIVLRFRELETNPQTLL